MRQFSIETLLGLYWTLMKYNHFNYLLILHIKTLKCYVIQIFESDVIVEQYVKDINGS